ncbi:MAG: sigma 54-dependent Fis family transcriptional regulator [Proteobacteria bacterium]|nr:sigma 54-dependent Fis family transcriptional regulator [Pseudomonadota bacterium]
MHLRQYKLVVLNGQQRGREVVVTHDALRIGKAPENGLVLGDDAISRQHCEIIWDRRGYLLRDLQSTNGTRLNGAEVREAYLTSGAVVGIGAIDLRFRLAEHRIEILPSEHERLGEMVGRSLAMREIFGLIEQIAPTDATVLISGETGTGKDMVARTLHQLSRRAAGPFVIVDCGAVSGTLIESELFGHEKGSFTGATAARQGAFERADGGTVFLDELGELSLDLQPKLLRVLEQREFRRVGGNRPIHVDIRVLAATRKNLRAEVEQGAFREDLFFRLSVVPLYVPALRERKQDIPLLVAEFERQFGAGAGAVPPEALEMMVQHEWPGNVRELRNVFERGIYFSKQLGADAFGLTDLVPFGSTLGPVAADITFDPQASYGTNKERWNDGLERRYVAWLLQRTNGNLTRAAREAQMDRKHLRKLLRKYGIRG